MKKWLLEIQAMDSEDRHDYFFGWVCGTLMVTASVYAIVRALIW